MKKVLLTTVATFSLVGSTFALAGGPVVQAQQAANRAGAYAGVDVGYAEQILPTILVKTDADTGFAFTNPNSTFNHFTAGAHVGYLGEFTPDFLFGVEVGYQYMPTTKYKLDETYEDNEPTNNVSVKYSDYQFNLSAVAKYYLTDQLNVFGKAGVAYVSQTINVNRPSETNTTTVVLNGEKIKPQVAAGIGYKVTPHVELTAQYSHLFGKKVKVVDNLNNLNPIIVPTSNSYLVGANYYFSA